MPNKVLVGFILFFSLLCVLFPSKGFTQSPTQSATVNGAASLGVAKMVEVKDKNVKDGSVISTTDKGAVLSSIPYDAQVIGVVARDAGIIISTQATQNGVPVISNGSVYLLVSTQNGAIKKGDVLTTSTIPGVAVKADREGYVLGTALEEYSNPNKSQYEKIAIDLHLHYFNSKSPFPGTLSDILKVAILPTKDAPSPIFKYIVAAAVVLGSFVLGFLTFGRTAAKGVEALGRNPSASKIIHLGIIFNVGIVVVIVAAGLVVAFLILRL